MRVPDKASIVFICARERLGDDRSEPQLKQASGGVDMANEKFTRVNAGKVLAVGEVEAAGQHTFGLHRGTPPRLLTACGGWS